jgi:hypothetical protein
MKTINLHNTQTKKAYKKPALKKIGDVRALTKGIKGSFAPDDGDIQDPT